MALKRNSKSVIRTVLVWGAGIFLFACLLFLFPFVKDSLVHDLALNGYVRTVKAVQQLADNSSLSLTFPENGRFPGNPDEWLPYDMTDLSTWLNSSQPRDHLYLISTWGIDLDPGWDMRCG
jgi:hypothetical protein